MLYEPQNWAQELRAGRMADPYDGGKGAASVVCSGWSGRGKAWFNPALPLQIVVNSHVIFEMAAEGSMESLRP